jgi:hypothetical protein
MVNLYPGFESRPLRFAFGKAEPPCLAVVRQQRGRPTFYCSTIYLHARRLIAWLLKLTPTRLADETDLRETGLHVVCYPLQF